MLRFTSYEGRFPMGAATRWTGGHGGLGVMGAPSESDPRSTPCGRSTLQRSLGASAPPSSLVERNVTGIRGD